MQFAGVAFICGLMYVVMLQYYYVLNKDLGYNPKRVVVANTDFGNKENQDYAPTFFRAISPYVESVSSADSHPVYSYSGTMIQMKVDNHFSPPVLRNDGRLSKDDGYGDEGGAYATE